MSRNATSFADIVETSTINLILRSPSEPQIQILMKPTHAHAKAVIPILTQPILGAAEDPDT